MGAREVAREKRLAGERDKDKRTNPIRLTLMMVFDRRKMIFKAKSYFFLLFTVRLNFFYSYFTESGMSRKKSSCLKIIFFLTRGLFLPDSLVRRGNPSNLTLYLLFFVKKVIYIGYQKK
jgi:hypothetical protein